MFSVKPQLTPSNSESNENSEAETSPDSNDLKMTDAGADASPNDQAEAARQAVRDFLAGHSGELELPETVDKSVREAVEQELLSAIAESGPVEQSYARDLFVEKGFLDEAIQDLRTAEDPARRAVAARALGNVGSQRGTAPLIAALFDDDPEVRRIAGEALAQIGDPAVANAPMSDLFDMPDSPSSVEQLLPPEIMPAEEIESASLVTEVLETEAEQFVGGDLSSVTNETELRQREDAVTKAMKELDRRMPETAAARNETEKEVRLRTEWETKFRAEIAIRRREEEERLAAEQIARVEAEDAAYKFAAEEARLRIEAANLRQMMTELAHKRTDLEMLASETAAAARRAEAQRAWREAEAHHNAELERLRNEEQGLLRAAAETSERTAEIMARRQEAEAQVRRLEEEKSQFVADAAARRSEAERMRRETEERGRAEQEHLLFQVSELRRVAEEVTLRRTEIEAARQKTEEEADQLRQTQAQMRASAENRQRQAEAERIKLETELRQQVENEQRFLEEARERAQEEQQRLQGEAQQRAVEGEKRLAELEALLKSMDAAGQELFERERRLNEQLETLQTSETEIQTKIKEAELRKRAAEESYRVTTDTVQRIEAEAHVRALEEERMLAKLEELRRTVAVEAQARVEQERRIKEEIELLSGMEAEQRERVQEESRRRAEVENRLEQEKELLKTEEEARLRAEVQLNMLADRYRAAKAETLEVPGETGNVFAATDEASTAQNVDSNATFYGPGAPAEKPHVVVADLNSTEPDKRVAALAALAQLSAKDAFSLIANCFDDQSSHVRNAAARALRDLEPRRTVESFTRALEEASPERRKNIGAAIADSGLAAEAINNLDAESREETYNALCLLFVMAKTGEVQPLVRAIEEHENVEVRRAAIKLLTLSGQSEIADAAVKRHLDSYRDNGDSQLPN